MPATIEAFIADLQKSNLLSGSQLAAVRTEVEQAQHAVEPGQIARRLVERGLLTDWQAEMLLAGRHAFFLGKYKLLDLLGQGGMGAVFTAEQTPLRRIVAVKVMEKQLVKDANAVARFRREIRAAAALNHPNIVTAVDADCVGDTHFLVMEYVEAEDLARIAKRQRQLPTGVACEYVRQAALGLQHAHERGMVHRDIKPGNLLLTWKSSAASSLTPDPCPLIPVVKILDMGLARFTSETAETGHLTQTGQVMGTPDYISPEQALDTRRADVRSDIYSLGCTLFWLLAGRVPFRGHNAVARIMARLNQDAPPLGNLRPDRPAELCALVQKTLSRDPADRFQTPAELAQALAGFAAVPEIAPTVTYQTEHLAAADKPVAAPPTVPAKPTAKQQAPHAPVDPRLQQFLQQLATEAAQDEEPEASTTNLGRTMPAEHVPPGSPARPPQPTKPSKKKPRRTRAGKKLQAELEARNRADRRRFLMTIAGVVAFLALLAGFVAWQKAGETLLILDWPPGERNGAFLKLDRREVPLPKKGKLEFPGRAGRRSIRLMREGYEPIEKSWTFGRGQTETFRPEWQPTPETIRNQELAALEQRVEAPAELAEPRVKATATLRNDLLDFRRRHYAFPDAAIPAARLMSRLPWPVDHLQREKIDPYELKIAGQVSRGASAPGSTPARSRGSARNPPLPELVAVLGDSRLKHWKEVDSVAFSPDGQTLASGSQDHTVKLWDMATGRERRTLEWHTEQVSCVAFSPDGQTLASGSWDRGVRLWDVKTGRGRFTLQGHTDWVSWVAFSPDGKMLASSGWDGTVRLWNPHIEQGNLLRTIQLLGPPGGGIQYRPPDPWWLALTFTPDSRHLVTANGNGTVYVLRLKEWAKPSKHDEK